MSVTANLGSSVTLSAVLSATTPAFAYQWNFNGQAIAGATSLTYTIPTLTAANAGQYTFQAAASAPR